MEAFAIDSVEEAIHSPEANQRALNFAKKAMSQRFFAFAARVEVWNPKAENVSATAH